MLSQDELKLLSTPLKDLSPQDRALAFKAKDKKDADTRKANEKFKPSFNFGGFVISDDLGIKGVKNPVDGKLYDSKSQYERAVREAGCVIVGNETQKQSRETRGDFNITNDLKRAAQQHGYI